MLRIGVLADPHYAPRDTVNGRYYRDSLRKLGQCAQVLQSERVDLAVNLGDLVDTTRNIQEVRNHLDAALDALSPYTGEWLHVLGNHDLLEFDKASFLEACTGRQGLTGESCGYYFRDIAGYRLVVLDGNFDGEGRSYNSEGFDWTNCYISPTQLIWLRDTLARAREEGLHVVVFTHENLDERQTQEGRDPHVVHNSGQVRSVLEESGAVLGVIQGHCHTGYYQAIGGIPYFTLPSMVVDPDGADATFGILELEGGRLVVTGWGSGWENSRTGLKEKIVLREANGEVWGEDQLRSRQERQTRAAVQRHAQAVASRDVDLIAGDYAEDAVLLTNLEPSPARGKAQVAAMIRRILDTEAGRSFSGENDSEMLSKDVAGEYLVQAFQSKSAGLLGVETYVVRDEKIVFESVVITPLGSYGGESNINE